MSSPMTRTDILDTIYALSQSQGMYSRFYAQLNDLAENDPETYERIMFDLENRAFKDPVDMVMFFEC